MIGDGDVFPSAADAYGIPGRSAVVTGAGSGIGRGIARALAGAGATVVCADIDPGSAAETAGLIQAAGGTASSAACDVSHRSEVRELVASAVAEYGKLDILCNNAGIIVDIPVLEISEREFDRVLATNLKGVLFGCQEAGAAMVARGSGSIVNIASGIIDSGGANLVAYGASKAGVVQITRTFATEVGPRGVRVNGVAPGIVETNITRRHYFREDGSVDEERREQVLAPMRAASPLGLVGSPADIGYAVLYLVSDAARFITGQTLRPNGGSAMPW